MTKKEFNQILKEVKKIVKRKTLVRMFDGYDIVFVFGNEEDMVRLHSHFKDKEDLSLSFDKSILMFRTGKKAKDDFRVEICKNTKSDTN